MDKQFMRLLWQHLNWLGKRVGGVVYPQTQRPELNMGVRGQEPQEFRVGEQPSEPKYNGTRGMSHPVRQTWAPHPHIEIGFCSYYHGHDHRRQPRPPFLALTFRSPPVLCQLTI